MAILVVIPLLVGITLLMLHLLQEKMIFLSYKLPMDYEFRFTIPFDERIFITNDGNAVHALHFKAEHSKGLIFYLHGNAGALDFWGGKAKDFYDNGYDVLMMDYRGYGKSDGRIYLEHHLTDDARYLYSEMLKEYVEQHIIIYGISLGTGIATILASENQPKMLMLETPYYNFLDVAKYHFPYLPMRLILKYRFRTAKHIMNVNAPIVVFHGTDDLTVPYKSSLKLQKKQPKLVLHTFKGGGHNDLNTFPEYHELLRGYLQD